MTEMTDRHGGDSGPSPRQEPDVSVPTPSVAKRGRAERHGRAAQAAQCFSAVVGSMIVLISEILFAGKPPSCACFRTISSLGATYTQ